MTTVKHIKAGDLVKLISGAQKGTTGKVLKVNTKDKSILIEGVGVMHRKVKPSQQNPRGGHKDIHVAIPVHKVALVVDDKTSGTSRIGMVIKDDGTKVRVARQFKNKEIK
jgi:large subunit ribosomal protein L24